MQPILMDRERRIRSVAPHGYTAAILSDLYDDLDDDQARLVPCGKYPVNAKAYARPERRLPRFGAPAAARRTVLAQTATRDDPGPRDHRQFRGRKDHGDPPAYVRKTAR